jgi:GntR family transcriptional regulator
VQLSINTSSRTPICRQLGDQIREGIARGRLLPDERLPSVRDLSRRLVVNPNTVARVYSDLEREGVLTTRPGLGVFVAKPGSDLSLKVRRERLRAAADRFLTEAVHLGFAADDVRKLLAECESQFQWKSGEREK